MPQISLYVDDTTLRKIQAAAAAEKVSLSSWVSSRIQESTQNTWPPHFFDLFGALSSELEFDPDQGHGLGQDSLRDGLE